MIFTNQKASPDARRQSVQAFLQLFGGQSVKFSFTESPQTDGKTVWLGNLDPSDEDFELYAAGHGIHEMMHVMCTDFAATPKKSATPILKTIINVLEDVRIDSIGAKAYPGYAEYRRQVAEKLVQTGRLHACTPAAEQTASGLFLVWLHAALMSEEPWSKKFLPAYDSAVRSQFGNELADKALRIGQKVFQAESTAEVVKLARKIEKLLKVVADEVQSEQSKTCSNVLEASEEECEQLKKLLDFVPPECEANRSSNPASASSAAQMDGCGYWEPDPELPETVWDGESYVSEFHANKDRQSQLARQFEKLLASRTAREESTCATHGLTLADDFVSTLAMRSTRLFSRESEAVAPDGTVEILLDRSGSMGLQMLTAGKVAVSALQAALAKAKKGISSEVAVFPGASKRAVAMVQKRGESLAEGMRRIASVTSYGGTPLWNAVEWSIKRLNADKARVKLLILITDGIFPARLLRDAESIISRAGIEFAVISIEAENHGLARNQVNVSKPEQIGPALLTLLQRTRARRRLVN